MKPRSGLVTDGMERAPARGMLRAVGMGDEDWVKPQIGIASSWNEITPCNLSLDRLAKASRKGIIDAGGFPMQFGTISVSDGISMGHEGMHFSLVSREVIADSVETVMQAERLDGMVTFAGCDKSLPGMMMAAARIDVASVFVYAGSTLPGNVDGKDVTSLAEDGVQHTLTIHGIPTETQDPLFINVPLPKTEEGQQDEPGSPLPKGHVVTFSFITGGKGEYVWNCEYPCGDATYQGFGAVMGATGYMSGKVSVL
jgi:hypothetical protein